MRVVPSFVRRLARSSWTLAALALLVAAPVAAQESPVVGADELNAALSDHSADVAADRATVLETLDRPEVVEVARRFGIDIEHARGAAGSLSGSDLARAVGVSQNIDQALAGGQTISISTITIILILLIVILVVLIA